MSARLVVVIAVIALTLFVTACGDDGVCLTQPGRYALTYEVRSSTCANTTYLFAELGNVAERDVGAAGQVCGETTTTANFDDFCSGSLSVTLDVAADGSTFSGGTASFHQDCQDGSSCDASLTVAAVYGGPG